MAIQVSPPGGVKTARSRPSNPWEKWWSPWAHRELTVSSRWPRWSRLQGPMITAQSRLGEVTAQSRRGHSSVTARSQLSHSSVTAQSRHLQYDHGSVMARSQFNHGPGHGSVTTGCDHFGHRELTVSWRWAHREFTMSSQWAVTVANFFFLMGRYPYQQMLPADTEFW